MPDAARQPDVEASPQSRLLAGLVRRGARRVALAQLVSQLISLAVLAALYRSIGPEPFGLLGMALTWVLLVRLFATGGINMAVVQSATLTPEQVSALYWVHLAVAATAAAIGMAGAPVVAWFYGLPELTALVVALSGTIVLAAMASVPQALVERRLQFGRLAVCRLAAQVVGGTAGVAAAFSGWNAWALVVQQYCEWGTLSILLTLVARLRLSRPSFRQPIGSLVRFGGYYSGSSLMFYLTTNLDKVLLGWWSGPAGERMLGLYSQAFNVMLRPVYVVTTPLAALMLPALARAAGDGQAFRQLAVGFFRFTALLLLPAGVGMFLVGDELMSLLGGPAWRQAGPLLVALAPAILAQGFINIAGSLLAATGRADRLLWSATLIAVLLAQGFAAGWWLGHSFGPAETGPALGVACSYSLVLVGVVLVPYLAYCFAAVGLPARDVLWVMRKPALAATGMGLAVAGVGSLFGRQGAMPGVRLALQVATGVVVYAFLVRGELRQLLRSDL